MEVKELKKCVAVRHPGRYQETLIHIQQIVAENFVQLCQQYLPPWLGAFFCLGTLD